MTDVSARGVRRMRRFADFAELNVRTYVTAGGKPGVWFFSLDATQPLAVRIARGLLPLPYLDARIDIAVARRRVGYASARTHRGGGVAELAPTTARPARRPAASRDARALPDRALLPLRPSPRGGLRRIEIDHAPWPLQPAELELELCTMTAAARPPLGDEPPLAHFAKRLDVVAWLPDPRGVNKRSQAPFIHARIHKRCQAPRPGAWRSGRAAARRRA